MDEQADSQPTGASPSSHNLDYQETPEIHPAHAAGEADSISEQLAELSEPELPKPAEEPELPAAVQPPQMEPHNGMPSRTRRGGKLGTLLFLAVMFVLGVAGSSALRQYLPEGVGPTAPEPTIQEIPLTPTPSEIPTTGNTAEYRVLSVGKIISPVSLRLPVLVLPPVCDDTDCSSQGTYLPGGTRLTISLKKGRKFTPGEKVVITDAAGTAFVQHETTVLGRPAIEYGGDFAGVTAGGYRFTKMRGVMVVLADETLELNHFAPSGVTADFDRDDVLYDQIVTSVSVPESTTPTGSGAPTP